MRICAVTPFPPTVAGVADYGAFLAGELARDPRVEHLTVLADRGDAAAGCVRIDKLEVRRVWERDRPDTVATLTSAIARNRPDVVWFNLGLTMFGTGPFASSGMIAPLAIRALGYPCVVTLHEMPPLADLVRLGLDGRRGRLAQAALMRVLLCANEVVVTLERYRSYLVARYGARNVTHIPHGMWEQPERLPEPDEETVLVFGTFGPHKDPGLVADAVTRLRRSRPNLRLIVAGADHPRYPGFMARCSERHGLGAAWIGYVPAERLRSFFARATVVVVPARASTGSSGVIHRAMGNGRAILASDLPDFRALACEQDLRMAWFRPGDVADLAVALGGVLDDPRRRDELVTHNLKALARVGPPRIAARYLKVFARGTSFAGSVDAAGGARARAMELVAEA